MIFLSFVSLLTSNTPLRRDLFSMITSPSHHLTRVFHPDVQAAKQLVRQTVLFWSVIGPNVERESDWLTETT